MVFRIWRSLTLANAILVYALLPSCGSNVDPDAKYAACRSVGTAECPAGFKCLGDYLCHPPLCVALEKCCGLAPDSEADQCRSVAYGGKNDDACAAELQAMTSSGRCVKDPDADRVCSENGQACGYNCCSRSNCVGADGRPNNQDGTCQACLAESVTCDPDHNLCCSDLRCHDSSKTCVQRSDVGERCTVSDDCDQSLECSEFKCKAKGGSGGSGGSSSGGQGCDPAACNSSDTVCGDGFCFSCQSFCENGGCVEVCN